jgi:DNA-binding CsgD family transcriptional regulator
MVPSGGPPRHATAHIDGPTHRIATAPAGWHDGAVMTPFIVIEGSEIALAMAIREFGAARCTAGFLPPFRPDEVRTGTVASAADAEAALLAALDGAGLILCATGRRDVIDRLVDDLRRLGPVDHRVSKPDAAEVLGPSARAILGLLAEGHSLGEAASILGLSRRTADRRLAEGRRALGVERTTEAIARARRLGWLARDARTDGGRS